MESCHDASPILMLQLERAKQPNSFSIGEEHQVELSELVNAIHVVELSAKTRLTAIRAMARAGHWEEEGIELESVLEAIE